MHVCFFLWRSFIGAINLTIQKSWQSAGGENNRISSRQNAVFPLTIRKMSCNSTKCYCNSFTIIFFEAVKRSFTPHMMILLLLNILHSLSNRILIIETSFLRKFDWSKYLNCAHFHHPKADQLAVPSAVLKSGIKEDNVQLTTLFSHWLPWSCFFSIAMDNHAEQLTKLRDQNRPLDFPVLLPSIQSISSDHVLNVCFRHKIAMISDYCQVKIYF